MSSISLSLKMMLAASACAGLTLLACGGDDSGGGSNSSDDDETGSKDAGKGKDAGKDAGKKDAGAAVELVEEGDECDPEAYGGLGNYGGACEGCGAAQCIAPCEDGVYGECKTAAEVIASFTADGGLTGLLRDSGFTLPDTGIVRTDGGFAIPGGDGGSTTLTEQECPADYMCDSTLTTFMLPATCVKPGANMVVVFDLPPKCTTNDDCKKLGLTGTCITIPAMGLIPAGSDKVCLAPCKP